MNAVARGCEIRNQKVPNTLGRLLRESLRRLGRATSWRVDVVCVRFFILFKSEKWKLKMLHVASPSRGRTHHSHSPRNTPSRNGEGVQCGVAARVRSAARAPAVGPAGLFVYDNNNGTHRIAKRTRWVVPTRRRRADLSDRGRGRRVVGRTIPWGGKCDGGGACLRHARRRVWG